MKRGNIFLIGCCMVLIGMPARAAILEKIRLANNSHVFLEFTFSEDADSIQIPPFFQQYDEEMGIFSIHFLKTRTRILRGSYPVLQENPFAGKITIRNVKGKRKGKMVDFLRVEFTVGPSMQKAKYKAVKRGPNTLALQLGKPEGREFYWTVSGETLPTSGKKYHSEISDAPFQDTQTARNEIEDTDSSRLEPELLGHPETLQAAEQQPLLENEGPQGVSTGEGADGDSSLSDLPFNPQQELGTPTAFELGVRIDTASHVPPPSSSNTFSVIKGGKTLVVLKDSINLRKGPGTSHPVVKILEAGNKVGRLSRNGQWFKISTGKDSGYIRQDMLAYKDEVTQEQQEQLEAIALRKAEARKKAEFEEKKKQDELAAREKAETEAIQKAKEERAQLMAETRRKAEEEKARLKSEAEARKEAVAETRRKAEEEKARLKSEAQARKEAEVEARRKAAEEKKRLKEETEARKSAEAEARRKEKEEKEKLRAEALVRKKAEELERRKAEEEKARLSAEEKAKKKAELDENKKQAALAARQKAEEERRRREDAERLKREDEMARKLAEKKQKEEEEKQKIEMEKKKIRYTSFGRRDPFVPVNHNLFGQDDISLDQMKLVGIIWNAEDPLVVLEHRSEPGISVALREGDVISNGTVNRISQDKVVFKISEYGVFRFYTLRLHSSGERIAQ